MAFTKTGLGKRLSIVEPQSQPKEAEKVATPKKDKPKAQQQAPVK